MRQQALLAVLAFVAAALVLPRIGGSAPAVARAPATAPAMRGGPSPSSARMPPRPAPTPVGDLSVRCLSLPYAQMGRPSDVIDAGGRCGAIVTPDGHGFREGTPEFRTCRDAVVKDWLSLMGSAQDEAREELQLEASLACFHLLWRDGQGIE